eukprot:1140364-Pelagomonas_calceolata.AAC.2
MLFILDTIISLTKVTVWGRPVISSCCLIAKGVNTEFKSSHAANGIMGEVKDLPLYLRQDTSHNKKKETHWLKEPESPSPEDKREASVGLSQTPSGNPTASWKCCPHELRSCNKCGWHTVQDEEHIILDWPTQQLSTVLLPFFWISKDSCFPATPGAYKLSLSGILQQALGLLGGNLLGAWQWRMGEGESGRPGAWRTTLQFPISSVSGSHLG